MNLADPLESKTPRVDGLLASAMKRYAGTGAKAIARYFEEVHQELAPLARELEAETIALRLDVDRLTKQLQSRGPVVVDKEPKP